MSYFKIPLATETQSHREQKSFSRCLSAPVAYLLNYIVLFYQSSFFEAGQVEHRNIHCRKVSIQNIFAHQLSGNRSMHEAMARKASTDCEAFHVACAKDRVRIGCHFIQSRPMRCATRPFEQWHALNRSFEIHELELFIHALIEAGLFILIAHADQ